MNIKQGKKEKENENNNNSDNIEKSNNKDYEPIRLSNNDSNFKNYIIYECTGILHETRGKHNETVLALEQGLNNLGYSKEDRIAILEQAIKNTHQEQEKVKEHLTQINSSADNERSDKVGFNTITNSNPNLKQPIEIIKILTKDYSKEKLENNEDLIAPTLTDEELEIAMNVQKKIEKQGFINYISKLINLTYIGNTKVIIQQLIDFYEVIAGLGSVMVELQGHSGIGKSYAQELALKLIPQRYIFEVNKMSDSAFNRLCNDNPYLFNRKIIYMGDKGELDEDKTQKELMNSFKVLLTEGKTKKVVSNNNSSTKVVETEIIADTIGIAYSTVKGE